MAINAVVTRGYASGGSIAFVVTRGYGVGAAVVVNDVPMGGAGYPVYWQGKRRKRKLKDQPLKHLEYVLNKVVAEYYGDIVESDLPKAVKQEAVAVVKPFVEKKTKGIPQVQNIDWVALQRDADSVGLLLQIWHEELLAKRYLQQARDEDNFLMMD